MNILLGPRLGACPVVIRFSVRLSVCPSFCASRSFARIISNMAARQRSWNSFRAHYLWNRSSNCREMFTEDCYLWEDVHFQISDRSEIQYGCQAAILEFLSCALSQEPFMQLLWTFLLKIGTYEREGALSNFRPIRNPIWSSWSIAGPWLRTVTLLIASSYIPELG